MTLAVGFASLESPRQPIADPMFTILEILIIIIMLTGLSGVVVGDMQQRNIVIVGYVGAFLVVATLLAVLFHRSIPRGLTRMKLAREEAVRSWIPPRERSSRPAVETITERRSL